MSERPLVAITMGDAAGIGAEVTAKALQDDWVYEKCRPFVVGSAAAMNSALELIGASGSRSYSPRHRGRRWQIWFDRCTGPREPGLRADLIRRTVSGRRAGLGRVDSESRRTGCERPDRGHLHRAYQQRGVRSRGLSRTWATWRYSRARPKPRMSPRC